MEVKNNTIDCFFDFFEKNRIPTVFSALEFKEGNFDIKNRTSQYNAIDLDGEQSYSILYVPDYFTPKLKSKDYEIKRVKQFFKGHAIFLKGYRNVETYLKSKFKNNAKVIKRKKRRLEKCFDISYEFHYGQIDYDTYNALMNSLKEMLEKRFEQKEETNRFVLNWEHYKQMFYNLILDKRASLFVIKDKDKPIVISIGYHYNKILFSFISSYDIDYEKFSPGSVEIYKKLEWCFANDHIVYEMGMGDFEYKKKWCNHVYDFTHLIVYKRNSLISVSAGWKEYLKVFFTEKLFEIAYKPYKKLKLLLNNKDGNTLNKFYKYLKGPIINKPEKLDRKLQLCKDDGSELFKKYKNDFLYLSSDHKNDVKIYQDVEDVNVFYILGTKKMQRLTEVA